MRIRVSRCFTLHPKASNKIDDIARERGITRSKVVEMLVFGVEEDVDYKRVYGLFDDAATLAYVVKMTGYAPEKVMELWEGYTRLLVGPGTPAGAGSDHAAASAPGEALDPPRSVVTR